MIRKDKKKNKINYGISPKTVEKILFYLIWSLILILFILTLGRITIIGQGIYDFFRFLFGWTQYLIFGAIIFFIGKKFNIYPKSWKKKFQIQKKRTYLKIFWFLLNTYWTLGLITSVILISIQNESWYHYQSYTLDQIIPYYYKEWLSSSVYSYDIKNAKDFFNWHKSFAENFDGGGILGLILASLSSYLQIIGALVLNLISWFFMYSYIKNNSVFYYLKNYENQKKIKWENINTGKNYETQTSTIDEIEDQDITIELDTARKLHFQDKKNQTSIAKKEYPKEKKEEEIKVTEFEIIPNNEEEDSINIENINVNDNDWHEIKKNESENTIKVDQLPSANLFEEFFLENRKKNELNKEITKNNIEKINNLFQQYEVKAKITKTQSGCRVTRYVISLEEKTKVQKILDLEPELKLMLATQNLRLEAPIPGQSAVGLEIPNKHVTYINWKEIATKIKPVKNSLLLGIGKNLMGEVEISKLEEMPHLLVAGSTGGGKSICLLALISSLIFQKNYQDLKLMLIDPKRVELTAFKDIPHLICPVITDGYKASSALDKILNEIEKRYKLLEEKQVNNIKNYNEIVELKNKLPFIVVVVDELADLILIHKQKIEQKIVRIGQIARAVGIFMILATQRPSNDIITGLIKTNIPARIAFNMTNHNDSRTILSVGGAEKLLGKGDLLFKKPGEAIKRIQGVWIGNNDIKRLTGFWKKQNTSNFYWKEFMDSEKNDKNSNGNYLNLSKEDEKLYEEIKMCLETLKEVSISLIQRKFNLGFNRAARLFDKLEQEKIISKTSERKNYQINHKEIKFQ